MKGFSCGCRTILAKKLTFWAGFTEILKVVAIL
jgi:hypothetical protein